MDKSLVSCFFDSRCMLMVTMIMRMVLLIIEYTAEKLIKLLRLFCFKLVVVLIIFVNIYCTSGCKTNQFIMLTY